MKTKKKFEIWTVVSLVLLAAFLLFLVYPMFGLLKQAVITPEGEFSLREFAKFFSKSYYTDTIVNSVKVTVTVTIVSLLLGIPIAYFYSFYKIRGAKALFVISILCSMSAPFIGAYSWIMLLGRSGAITQFLEGVLGISVGSIYGFKGILIVQSLKFFPLVFIYMNGAFKNIDNTLMEASANMGCTGVRRLVNVVLALSMPTRWAGPVTRQETTGAASGTTRPCASSAEMSTWAIPSTASVSRSLCAASRSAAPVVCTTHSATGSPSMYPTAFSSPGS